MQFTVVLTERPAEATERKTILWTDEGAGSPEKALSKLLEELSIRSQEGWNIFSVKGALNGHNIWCLTKNKQTNFLEMKRVD